MSSSTKSKNVTFKAKIISAGRITIPDIERELLKLKCGDKILVTIEKIQKEVEATC